MSRTYDIIIFDLDGTLADTAPDVAFGVNQALHIMGFEPLKLEQVKKAVGPGREEFIRNIFPGVENPDTETFLTIFREIYWEHCLEKTVLFHGMEEVLTGLEALSLNVATNKPKVFTEKILKGLGVRDRFDEVVGPEDVNHAKPDPEMIIKIVEDVGGEPTGTLLIGDTDRDILAGQRGGVGVCGARYGYGCNEDMESLHPDFFVDHPAEILEIIENSHI